MKNSRQQRLFFCPVGISLLDLVTYLGGIVSVETTIPNRPVAGRCHHTAGPLMNVQPYCNSVGLNRNLSF
jgi:hypothetical protein